MSTSTEELIRFQFEGNGVTIDGDFTAEQIETIFQLTDKTQERTSSGADRRIKHGYNSIKIIGPTEQQSEVMDSFKRKRGWADDEGSVEHIEFAAGGPIEGAEASGLTRGSFEGDHEAAATQDSAQEAEETDNRSESNEGSGTTSNT